MDYIIAILASVWSGMIFCSIAMIRAWSPDKIWIMIVVMLVVGFLTFTLIP